MSIHDCTDRLSGGFAAPERQTFSLEKRNKKEQNVQAYLSHFIFLVPSTKIILRGGAFI